MKGTLTKDGRPFPVLIVIAVLMVSSPAAAELYKYLDEDGSVIVTTEKRQGLKLIEVIGGAEKKPARRAAKRKAGRRHLPAARPKATLPRVESEVDTGAAREKRYDAIIREAARTYKIPISFIKGVIRVESNFNPHVVSHAGAMGLMQLMPGTARYLGVSDPFDPKQNIFGGTKLLRMLTNKYNGDINLLLSAYNAGEGAVARYDGIPYNQTREYVRKVYRFYKQYQFEETSRKGDGAPR
jgi:soluble lytic murein transglycosylase-like protein